MASPLREWDQARTQPGSPGRCPQPSLRNRDPPAEPPCTPSTRHTPLGSAGEGGVQLVWCSPLPTPSHALHPPQKGFQGFQLAPVSTSDPNDGPPQPAVTPAFQLLRNGKQNLRDATNTVHPPALAMPQGWAPTSSLGDPVPWHSGWQPEKLPSLSPSCGWRGASCGASWHGQAVGLPTLPSMAQGVAPGHGAAGTLRGRCGGHRGAGKAQGLWAQGRGAGAAPGRGGPAALVPCRPLPAPSTHGHTHTDTDTDTPPPWHTAGPGGHGVHSAQPFGWGHASGSGQDQGHIQTRSPGQPRCSGQRGGRQDPAPEGLLPMAGERNGTERNAPGWAATPDPGEENG